MKNRTITFTTILLALGFLALWSAPKAFGVVPPPDGGYPGFNTAEGQNALFSLSTGSGNTAVGWFSLFSNVDGSFNTATGAGTLLFNTADANTAFGTAALLFNSTGFNNTAVGAAALLNNTEGESNTATGAFALRNNATGNGNTADGNQALLNNTEGALNTAVGAATLVSNTIGNDNTGVGLNALFSNTEGENNTALGRAAMGGNTTGSNNTAIGWFALQGNTIGTNNTALGNLAGGNITGVGNVCIGEGVLGEAGINHTTWMRNVNTVAQTFNPGVNNYVTVRLSDGRLGHTAVVSSQRYKQDIKPLAAASEGLYGLKPVSFRLKKEFDPTQALGFGLIAEEVEKVDPALVYRNDKGQVESVRYEMVNAMLLNEFLKEHKKVEEQQATIAELKSIVAQQQKGMEVLTAQLKEQAAQIQKVSAQLAAASPSHGGLETSKFAAGGICSGRTFAANTSE